MRSDTAESINGLCGRTPKETTKPKATKDSARRGSGCICNALCLCICNALCRICNALCICNARCNSTSKASRNAWRPTLTTPLNNRLFWGS